MRTGQLLRAAFLAAVLPAMAAFASPPAAGAQGACPADATALLRVSGGSGTLYAFQILARAAQLLSGDVAVDTSRGWFSVPLRGVKIARTPGGFSSVMMYARFPESVRIVNSWLWHAQGTQCPPPLPNVQRERTWPYPPGRASSVIRVSIMQPYGRTDCAQPFSPARALNIVEPEFDRRSATFPGAVTVDVTIQADGKPSQAIVSQSSGTGTFDDAARDAALRSTYAPATAYCMPTVSHYLYKATLRP